MLVETSDGLSPEYPSSVAAIPVVLKLVAFFMLISIALSDCMSTFEPVSFIGCADAGTEASTENPVASPFNTSFPSVK